MLAGGKRTPGLVWALSGVELGRSFGGRARRAEACPRRRDPRRPALCPLPALSGS